MTRLHEQLHEKSTPEEEALTLTMLSEEAQEHLIKILNLAGHPTRREKIYVCNGQQIQCRDRKVRVAFREPDFRYGAKVECYKCSNFKFNESCEGCPIENCNSKRYGWDKSYSCQHKPAELTLVSAKLKIKESRFRWKYELEKICKRGDFIIGYIDVYCKVEYEKIYDLEIEPTWIWPSFTVEKGEKVIIVECKPKVKTFQGVLRQIKTYMDIMKVKNPIGIIATYSSIPKSIQQLLLNENVLVVQAPKPGEKWREGRLEIEPAEPAEPAEPKSVKEGFCEVCGKSTNKCYVRDGRLVWLCDRCLADWEGNL